MKRRFVIGLFAVYIALSIVAPAETSRDNSPAMPDTAHEKASALATAVYERNSITSISAPHHLLATFETFKQDGTPDGNGSIELFFVSLRSTKTITHFRDHQMTEYGSTGRPVYTDDGFSDTIMVYRARQFLLHTLYASTADRRDLALTQRQLGPMMMDCLSFQFFLTGMVEGHLAPQPPREQFCLTQDTHDLTLMQTENISVRFRDYAPFLDKSIARTISASIAGQIRVRIHIEKLEKADLTDADVTAPEGASPANPAANILAISHEEATPLKAPKLVYPKDMRAQHVGGFVAVQIYISKTGKITDVEPVYSPSPSILQTGLDGLNETVYAPIIRNGKPVACITTIHRYFGPNP